MQTITRHTLTAKQIGLIRATVNAVLDADAFLEPPLERMPEADRQSLEDFLEASNNAIFPGEQSIRIEYVEGIV